MYMCSFIHKLGQVSLQLVTTFHPSRFLLAGTLLSSDNVSPLRLLLAGRFITLTQWISQPEEALRQGRN